jgi:hypothetical protein
MEKPTDQAPILVGGMQELCRVEQGQSRFILVCLPPLPISSVAHVLHVAAVWTKSPASS